MNRLEGDNETSPSDTWGRAVQVQRASNALSSEESWLGQYYAKKTSNARVEDKGEKSRSEGHKGSGIDYGVKLMQ